MTANEPSSNPAGSGSLGRLLAWGSRTIDVRAGEGSAVVLSFLVLLLVLAGHTMLETARDTLLLSRMPRHSLGIVYVLIAVLTLPAGMVAARMTERWGPKASLSGSLLSAAGLVAIVRTLPASPATAMTLYVLTGLIGSILVPQFWTFVAGLFTVSQGRRLFGPIAFAGVLGGFLGSGMAALAVRIVSSRQLLVLASAIFILAAVRMVTTRVGEGRASQVMPVAREKERLFSKDALLDVRRDPFVRRIAALVFVSTAAVLTIDYLFKLSVAETVPPDQLGPYLATYYTVLNAISLLMQLFVGGALVRKLGATSAALVTPFLMSTASLGLALTGGAHRLVLAAKGVDGALRYSVHRISSELLYLPIADDVRARIKPFIDGALTRIAQAVTACVLLTMAESGHLKRHRMIGMLLGLSLAWLLLAWSTRKPYLAVFRKALLRDPTAQNERGEVLTFATVEMLVERLAHPNPEDVVAAIRVLRERGRQRLVPAIILYHPSPRVLVYALEVFSATTRADWIPLAEPLVSHADADVRMAALRALCRTGRVDLLEKIDATSEPRIRGYVSLWLALLGRGNVLENKRVQAALESESGETATLVREGMLAAIADAPPSPELGEALLRFLELGDADRAFGARASTKAIAYVDLLSMAAAKQRTASAVPLLVRRLGVRAGRDSIREALVKHGAVAFRALTSALADETTPRDIRVHIPRTLARFGTQAAANALLANIESEKDGLVRYKSIRGLGGIARELRIRVDRSRLEKLVFVNLVEYLRLTRLRVALGHPFDIEHAKDARRATATQRFLGGLLDDKQRQALERAFRLLQVAFPKEDIHGVHDAALSNDKHLRANAGEFLDTLLTLRRHKDLRDLLRVVTDDLEPEERVLRSSEFFEEAAPTTHEEGILALAADHDAVLSSIAVFHAKALGAEPLLGTVRAARKPPPATSPTPLGRFAELSEEANG